MHHFDAWTRRQFLAGTTAALLAGDLIAQDGPKHVTLKVPAKAVTKGPKHHFFGYYDKCPWHSTGRYLLAGETGFIDRQPKPGEKLTVGMIDREDGDKYIELDRTPAWSWQQGTMLQWLGSGKTNSIGEPSFLAFIAMKSTRMP